MRVLRGVLLVVGVVAVLAGVLFVAQGSGVFPYPRSSFMISQTPWIYRGAGIAASGVVLLVVRRFVGAGR
jgi:hypothetical protein